MGKLFIWDIACGLNHPVLNIVVVSNLYNSPTCFLSLLCISLFVELDMFLCTPAIPNHVWKPYGIIYNGRRDIRNSPGNLSFNTENWELLRMLPTFFTDAIIDDTKLASWKLSVFSGVTITCGAVGDDEVGITKTFSFLWRWEWAWVWGKVCVDPTDKQTYRKQCLRFTSSVHMTLEER